MNKATLIPKLGSVPSSPARVKVIDLYDGLVRKTSINPVQGLDAATFWLTQRRGRWQPYALTLAYRAFNAVSDANTVWVHVPLDGTWRLYPIKQHAKVLRLLTINEGRQEMHWFLPRITDAWTFLGDYAYKLGA